MLVHEVNYIDCGACLLQRCLGSTESSSVSHVHLCPRCWGRVANRTEQVPIPPAGTERRGDDKCSKKECADGGLRRERLCHPREGELTSSRKPNPDQGAHSQAVAAGLHFIIRA